MSKSAKDSTQERLKNAPYDQLGWILKALEHAYDIAMGRLSAKHMKLALRMTRKHLNAWRASISDRANWEHERAILGVEANLFTQHPADVLTLLCNVDWDDIKRLKDVKLPLELLPSTQELIASSSRLSRLITDEGIPLFIVIALYAVQTMLPNGCPLSPIYFDLTRNSIDSWIIQENEIRSSRGNCELTGAEQVPTVHVRRTVDDSIVEVSSRHVRQNTDAFKVHKNIEVVAVKQVGMPILATCSCCILRRPNRPTKEDPNVPAFPLSRRYHEENELLLSLGNPIDAGQRVLTMCYLKVYADRKGTVHRQFRRLCPACMAVAIRNPEEYHAFIQELS